MIYSRGRSIGSFLIRAASWFEQWSHCGIITPEGTVVEAQAFKGVVETPLREFIDRSTEYEIVTVDCPNPSEAIAWARSKIGSGYDYGAIVGFVLREPLDKPNRYHCVDLLESAIIMGGRSGDKRRFRVRTDKITPTQSFRTR